MNSVYSAVAELRSRWYALHDLDRAQAIECIHRSGISLRELAAHLNCSPSLLTHLLQAAQASIEDRELARQGVLSTRALVRHARALGTRRTAIHREEIAFENERAALQGCKSILNWLADQCIANTVQGLIIENALLQLSMLERPRQYSQDTNASALPTDCIVGHSVQIQPGAAEIDLVTGLVDRFAPWVMRGIPDARIRQRALELALEELEKRQSSVTFGAQRHAVV